MKTAMGILVLAAMLLPGRPALGDILFLEDFQDGDADGWSAGGDGDAGMNDYLGNITLRLTKQAYVLASVEVEGGSRIRVGATFAADGLEGDDVCLGQVSFDGGQRWETLLRVADGQDDSITLHGGGRSFDVPPDVDSILLLARVAGNGDDDTCWLDNAYVVASGAGSDDVSLDEREFTRAFLLGRSQLTGPVRMAEYARPDSASGPRAAFSGSLALTGLDDGFRVVLDSWDRVADIGGEIRQLPEFEFRFVQRGSDLIPLERGVIRREHPYWEIVLQPGIVWSETEDGGWTRASLPFALQERSANCTHNGVMTWLFNEAGEVSRVAYQVSSETCGYFKADMWGIVDAEYLPADYGDEAAAAIAAMDAHRANRLPVRPIEQLTADYPGVDPLGFGLDDGINPADMSVFGMIVDGVHYRSDCFTRAGPYPFCDVMPLPSYSTAKSIFAGVATMRMEAMSPGSSQRAISSLVPECDDGRWEGVTIEHALDMATGNYRGIGPSEDEESVPHRRFVFDDRHASKLAFACTYFPRRADPGTRFVYHTSDTYLVGVGLAALLREQDDDGDLYRDVLAQPLWQRLALSPLMQHSKRTYDDTAQPFAGYGMTYATDDVARVADWLNRGEGRIGDDTVIDPRMLAASLQRRDDDPGLAAGSNLLRYNNGFWAYDAGPSLGCESSVWVPFMSGVSGISVAMFPNGVVYYYFSDSYVFRWQSARVAAHTIESLCQ